MTAVYEDTMIKPIGLYSSLKAKSKKYKRDTCF